MSISALNFKPYDKGSMRGFFDLRYFGLAVKGCRLMDGKNGLWVALPQKEITKDGERAWVDQLHFTPPEADHVRKAVLSDLEQQGHLPKVDRNDPVARNVPSDKKRASSGQNGQHAYQKYTDEDLTSYYPDGGGGDIPF